MKGKIPLAVQLYSVREDCKKDLESTLEAVANMGYEGVEFAGYYERNAADLKKILDNLGLRVAGTHIGLGTLLGDELERTVEFNKTIDNKFLVVPGLPEERCGSRGAWLETAGIFNEISEKLSEEGMSTGYHNHVIEFTPMDGEQPWDTFFGNTDQRVIMQLDTGNALHGGADPVPIMERYPGRARTVHLKEYSEAKEPGIIGEGDVRWDDFLRLCEESGGTEWYIVEQEVYKYPPIECVERCLKNLKNMGL